MEEIFMASTVDVAEIKRKIEQDLYELERCCKQYEDEEFCNKLRNKYVSAYNKLLKLPIRISNGNPSNYCKILS